MISTAVIAEFNPFHNGHQYIIETARTRTNADIIIVVMSGNYVQRGGPALLDKFTRTKYAIEHGADIVIELPIFSSMGKADCFATGAIAILEAFYKVDYLCFGCETDHLHILEQIADVQLNPESLYQQQLREYLSEGYAFARASQMAMETCVLSGQTEKFDLSMLEQPNTLLAIEYLKAIRLCHSSIQPFVIERRDSGYHSNNIIQCDGITFQSASAIRNEMAANQLHKIVGVPNDIKEELIRFVKKNSVLYDEDFFSLIRYKLLTLSKDSPVRNMDTISVNSKVLNRIVNAFGKYNNLNDFLSYMTSKNITKAYTRRMLFHILFETYESIDVTKVDYIRILGISASGAKLLKQRKESSYVTPLLRKLADDIPQIKEEAGLSKIQKCIQADEIYYLLLSDKTKQPMISEFERTLIHP